MKEQQKPQISDQVSEVFSSYPELHQKALLQLRDIIYATAAETVGVGELEETLKWGQPSYLTAQTKSGTTIRIDRFGEDKIAVYVHCGTTLVDTFRSLFSDQLTFSKDRAIVLDPAEPLPENELRQCIKMAFTYHIDR